MRLDSPLLRGIARGLGVHCVLLLLTFGGSPNAWGQTETWSFRDAFSTERSVQNPVLDRRGEAVWYLLRTTTSEGTVEARSWLRDGKYEPLLESGDGLFDAPVNGWAFRAAPPLAPIAGIVTADYDVGLTFRSGEMLVAPGPDHAVVIGWRSPVAGKLEIEGEFEHAQNCCGLNSQVAWYVERGPAPDPRHGFVATSLASGTSDFGSPSQRGRFKIEDQPVEPGDFVYFIVDAVADGTSTPHHGDATRFDVTLTVPDATRPPTPTFEQDVLPILARSCFECH
ncbi:MAG: hypothetical protein KDA83_16465, partial [Planctomycetales bacterium]|nr:hypothetical protein [Planctomycetales bacterium]